MRVAVVGKAEMVPMDSKKPPADCELVKIELEE